MDFGAAREAMVAQQIVARGVRNPRVLEAMRSVERHLFVPPALMHEAYDDRPLPLGEGQSISQPYMVASMTEVLEVAPTHRVLEIGTGSGYQTAVLAMLAGEVVSMERHPSLADTARAALDTIGITNVIIIVGDGTAGYLMTAPYDRILVTAGAPVVPETLKTQLTDGGRLVIPVGPSGFQRVTIVDRSRDTFKVKEGEGCVFVPLIGQHGWDGRH